MKYRRIFQCFSSLTIKFTSDRKEETHSSEQILKIEVNLNLFQLKQKLNSLILGKIEVKE